jgi:hypothetical protein
VVSNRIVRNRVVSHKVIGIKDSSKTVVRKSNSGQQVKNYDSYGTPNLRLHSDPSNVFNIFKLLFTDEVINKLAK